MAAVTSVACVEMDAVVGSGPRTQLTNVCVNARSDRLWEGQWQQTHTLTHWSPLFCADTGWRSCGGVTRFACATPDPAPVTVESFLSTPHWPADTMLMFLHALAALNNTAEEEWERYEACVAGHGCTGDLRSVSSVHCCGRRGTSVF